jgi:hypothetical protein
MAADSITDSIVGNYNMFGIQALNANVSARQNTVRNMRGNSTRSGLHAMLGMVCQESSGSNTISNNTIHSLHNSSGAARNFISGIFLRFPPTANIVERNFVHSLSMTSSVSNGVLVGIWAYVGNATYRNNMVALGQSVPFGLSVYGIYDRVGSNAFYHNSVYVGGTGVVTSASNTYAFYSTQTTVTRVLQDNVFVSARSNATTGGRHYAIRVGGTTSAPPGLTLNYNDYWVTGNGGVFGYYNGSNVTSFAAWKLAPLAAGRGPGLDANSFNDDPHFLVPNGTSSSVDLHINPATATVIEAQGLAITSVTDDFDGEMRAGLTPTDIGADAGNFIPQ